MKEKKTGLSVVSDVAARTESLRAFLRGGPKVRNFVMLDPSSYAAEFAGKTGGMASATDNFHFIQSFPNDTPVACFLFPDQVLSELKWKRTPINEKDGENRYEETFSIGSRTLRRVIAEKKGTTPWLVESAIKTADDFILIDYYADCVLNNAQSFARVVADTLVPAGGLGYMTESVLLVGFESYYLIDYPDMPIFFYDCKDRYMKSIQKIQAANHALIDELIKHGCEMFGMGSAGLELLSPRIFDEAIIPFAREITDHARSKGAFSSYHICGHSRQLLESGRINAICPTWFETFSGPPCGNVSDLRQTLACLDEGIISKGNLALELLRNGTEQNIRNAVEELVAATKDRRHIIGQADGTILSGTPVENIRAFLDAAQE